MTDKSIESSHLKTMKERSSSILRLTETINLLSGDPLTTLLWLSDNFFKVAEQAQSK